MQTQTNNVPAKNKMKRALYRLEQVIIIVAHLALLKWIFYALYQGGTLSSMQLMGHFVGMALYGAFLIRFCAWIAHKRWLKQQKLENATSQS